MRTMIYYNSRAKKILFAISVLVTLILSTHIVYASDQCIDKGAIAAKEALIKFFTYLHSGQFNKAVPLFEPWVEGEGLHRSSWEGLSDFSLPEDRNDKSKVLSNYCGSVGTCLNVDVINIEKIAEGKYKLRVQFFRDNKSVYIFTPCCGATEEQMPLKAVFDYYVHKINGVSVVRTPPLYRP